MKRFLHKIKTPYVDAQTLLNFLKEYRKPRDYILRLVKNGELIRLKNGFYLIADKISQGGDGLIPYEQIANMLYGPSYVSLDWALSYYGMIPERVYTVTSMTLGRAKEYHTPIGDFAYYKGVDSSYSLGITRKESLDFMDAFLIASPEKALVDLVHKTCRGLDKEQLKEELLESRRMDPENLRSLDKLLLKEITASFKSNAVKYLSHLLGEI